MTAHSPSGRAVPLEPRHPPPSAAGTTASSATFQPDEAGTWTIAITYKGEHIQVSKHRSHTLNSAYIFGVFCVGVCELYCSADSLTVHDALLRGQEYIRPYYGDAKMCNPINI